MSLIDHLCFQPNRLYAMQSKLQSHFGRANRAGSYYLIPAGWELFSKDLCNWSCPHGAKPLKSPVAPWDEAREKPLSHCYSVHKCSLSPGGCESLPPAVITSFSILCDWQVSLSILIASPKGDFFPQQRNWKKIKCHSFFSDIDLNIDVGCVF